MQLEKDLSPEQLAVMLDEIESNKKEEKQALQSLPSVEKLKLKKPTKAESSESLDSLRQSDCPIASNPLFVKLIVFGSVAGLNNEHMAMLLGVNESSIDIAKQTGVFSDLYNQAIACLSLTGEQRIAKAIPLVLDKKMKILTSSKDEKLVSQVGSEFLDRHYGKATQTVQTIGTTLQVSTTLEDIESKTSAVLTRLAKLESSRNKLLYAKSVNEPIESVDQ